MIWGVENMEPICVDRTKVNDTHTPFKRVGDEWGDGPFLRLQERLTWGQEHISLPPEKRRLSPRGGGRLPAGVEGRELAEGGQAGPAEPCMCLGPGKFEGLFRHSNPSQNSLKRENNTSSTVY